MACPETALCLFLPLYTSTPSVWAFYGSEKEGVKAVASDLSFSPITKRYTQGKKISDLGYPSYKHADKSLPGK